MVCDAMVKTRTGILCMLTLLSVLIVTSLFVGSASAITNGSPDAKNHPYVCLVAFYNESGNPLWYTTGALISPDVVITSGHGTSEAIKAKVWFLTYIDETVYYQSTYEGIPYTNPDYSGISVKNALPTYISHDVGVVKLSTKVEDIVPATLPTVGLVDTIKMKTTVDLVGYGVQLQQKGGGVRPIDSWVFSGYRYYPPAQIINNNGVLSSEVMKLTTNSAQDKGGSAFGYSGGPVLQAGTNVILGLDSLVTNSNCGGVTYAQRIDLSDILSWVTSYI
jgi:hypothetical protein